MVNATQFQQCVKQYINNPKYDCGHVVLEGKNNVLISAPHGVPQTRLGKLKTAEIGSSRLAYILAKQTNSHLIMKTQNLFDDVNFDENCSYRQDISNLIKKKDIKYLIDIHGLAKFRDCDINLGTNIGQNVKNNIELFDEFKNHLEKEGFSVYIDQPFNGSYPTISGCFARDYNIWTLQVEVNCSITNEKGNLEKLNKLIDVLSMSIKKIK